MEDPVTAAMREDRLRRVREMMSERERDRHTLKSKETQRTTSISSSPIINPCTSLSVAGLHELNPNNPNNPDINNSNYNPGSPDDSSPAWVVRPSRGPDNDYGVDLS